MPIKLESLQSEISKKKANWTPKATVLSDLNKSQKAEYLGLDVKKEELAATEKAISAVNTMESTFSALTEEFSVPTAVDWRNNGGNFTTPVKDQKSCGSCVSFGTLATIESRMKIACKNPNMTPDYSEAFLFYCGCGNCCGNGWNFPPSLNYCMNTGVAAEVDFPYTPGNQACKTGVPIQFKISNWKSILSISDRKNILASKGPMVAGMEVFEDFYSYSQGVYRHVTGTSVGYHAISVVGYDDNQECWICKNSWNTTWGESGWFKIGYGECGIDSQFPFYDIDLTCPSQPTQDCSKYLPLLKQVLILAQSNLLLRRCLRRHVCGKLSIPFYCPPNYIAVANVINKILQVCPQYRKSFCNIIG